MLLAIVAIFLCCNCLAFCNNIYEIVRDYHGHVDSNVTQTDPGSKVRESLFFQLQAEALPVTSECQKAGNIANLLYYFICVKANETVTVPENQDLFDFSVELSNILISLNSSSSIFVYFVFSSKYRSIIKHWLGLEKRKKVYFCGLTDKQSRNFSKMRDNKTVLTRMLTRKVDEVTAKVFQATYTVL